MILLALSLGANAAEPIPGWILAGAHPEAYTAALDRSVFHTGRASASLRASPGDGFGTVMQTFAPGDFAGQRLRLTAWIRSERVGDWAGLWMRVDGPNGAMLAFDNMQSRPIAGTTPWTRYEVVLDVDDDAVLIAYGVLLGGTSGAVWVDDVAFEGVDDSVPTTSLKPAPQPIAPINTDFEAR